MFYLISGGFDRYVKWYDYRHGNDDKVFVKHKINSLCLLDFEEDFEESEQSEIADSGIPGGNHIG